MKTILFSFITLLFIGSNAAFSAGDEKEIKIKTSAICEMCKARIERNLGLSKGVKESNLNLKDKVVTVKYNPAKTTPEAIKATIINTGYDADNQLANQKAHDKLPSCCRKTAAPH
ncbi:heavy-metal-associated domain-containing protein [Dyadobacter sp. Leaf189]|uniref:heavy-metal-associated domain-containing protein n=1 Tax=Dyadobacter sp. Leaf189 TaxID=1736295 RepID=UPI0006F79137|nr:heavy metal-associated domain-containing protein [Dyadobacter sp. Leaf189]KQS24758.1 heavy metal transporter [Dyadobacter sp. Leaf189]